MVPPNETSPDQSAPGGFKRISQIADAGFADTTGNALTEQAGESIGLMQRLIEDEIRVQPYRALGWAAATGFVVGLIAAR